MTPQEDREQLGRLLDAARDAAATAYCPFSKFHVGSAVLAEGKVFLGCNIENASFGLTICAERVAIFKAISTGVKKIDAIAVSCPDALEASPINMKMPCGACRQVIAEFAVDDCVVIIDRVGEFLLSQLLPSPFRL